MTSPYHLIDFQFQITNETDDDSEARLDGLRPKLLPGKICFF